MKLKKDSSRMVLLVLIAAGLGIYHILTAVLCHRDCGFYVEFARNFQSGFSNIYSDKRFGYPLMIFGAHKIWAMFLNTDSIYAWIYSAQMVSLICRVLAIIPLYYLAKRFLKSEFVFPAILIIVLLPYPAKFGADVIRVWPYFLFLCWSVFFLIKGFDEGKVWYLVLSALICGMGYFIRPEINQMVIYFAVFSVFNLIFKSLKISRYKTVLVGMIFILIILCFGYIYYKNGGDLMPGKLRALLENKLDNEMGRDSTVFKASGELLEGVSENSFWFFTPFAFLGIIDALRKKSNPKPTMAIFIISFIVLNSLMLILLHLKYGYIERRHTMSLTIMICLFVPRGIDILSGHLNGLFRMDKAGVFKIILTVGLIVCLVKLFIPMEYEKKHYVKAIEWLKRNVKDNEVIIVEDPRLGFYPQKRFMHLSVLSLDRRADYVVVSDRSDDISVYRYDTELRIGFASGDKNARTLEIYEVVE